MKGKIIKRAAAAVMALAMVGTGLPAELGDLGLFGSFTLKASAADSITVTEYSWNGSALTTEQKTFTDYSTLTWGNYNLANGTYVVSDDIVLYSRVTIPKDATVNLIVKTGKTLTCKEGIDCGYNSSGKYGTLNIYGGGKIVATGDNKCAGIGGGEGGKDPNESSPTIKIYAGKITAAGGIDGAGIGGGDEQPGARTYIYSGNITASSAKHGAGIGGGDEEGTYGVWIYEAPGYETTVTATGGDHGAGIGAGEEGGNLRSGNNGGVNILGGNVTAKGGDGAAGIGGGWGENVSGEINILGNVSKLNVTGGYNGAGIGSGGCNNSFKKGDMKARIEINCGPDSDISIISGAQGAGIGAGEGGNVSGKVYINGGKIKIKGYYGGAGIGGGCEAGQFNIGGEGGTVYIGGGDLTIHVCDYVFKAEAIGSGTNDYVSGTVYIAADNNKTNKYMRVSYNKDNDNFFSLPAAPNATAKAGDRTSKCHSNCSLFITECDHTDHNGNSGLSYTDITETTHTEKCKYCGYERKNVTHTGAACPCGYERTMHTVHLNLPADIEVADGNIFTLPYSEGEIIIKEVTVPPTYDRVIGWTLDGDASGKVYKPGEEVTVTSNMSFDLVTEKVYKIECAAAQYGKLASDAEYAKAGDIVKFSIEPELGYSIGSVTYTYLNNSSPIEIIPVDGVYQVTIPEDACDFTVTAEFNKDTSGYPITISNGIKDGTVTSDKKTADKGVTVTLTAKPVDNSYYLSKISCKTIADDEADETEIEVDQVDDTTYTFVMPAASVIVSADFEEVDHIKSYVSGASLTLKGDIGVNIYLRPCTDLSGRAYVTVEGPNDAAPEKLFLYELPTVDKYGYKITRQLSAQQMGTSVKICLYNDEDVQQTIYGSDQTTEYPNGFSYSPTDYFGTVENNTIFTDQDKQKKLENLCTAMERYGEYARKHFKDKKNYPTVCDLTDEDKEEVGNVDADMINKPYIPSTYLPSGVTFAGATLSLKSETTLSFYFTGDLENPGFFCSTAVSENADWNGKKFFNVETVKSGEYTIARVRGINAKLLGNTFQLTVKGNYSVNYSPMTYCYNVLSDIGSTYDDDLKNVCRALYLYWQASAAYFA